VIPNDTRQYFCRPIASEGQLATMPPKWKFCHPIFGRITCAHKRVEQLSGRTAEYICLAAGLCSGPYQENLQRFPRPTADEEGVAAHFPRTRIPLTALLAFDLWINAYYIHNKPGIANSNRFIV